SYGKPSLKEIQIAENFQVYQQIADLKGCFYFAFLVADKLHKENRLCQGCVKIYNILQTEYNRLAKLGTSTMAELEKEKI
ncbi:39231_t:CDS:2, partial [Gigaspora margarita]